MGKSKYISIKELPEVTGKLLSLLGCGKDTIKVKITSCEQRTLRTGEASISFKCSIPGGYKIIEEVPYDGSRDQDITGDLENPARRVADVFSFKLGEEYTVTPSKKGTAVVIKVNNRLKIKNLPKFIEKETEKRDLIEMRILYRNQIATEKGEKFCLEYIFSDGLGIGKPISFQEPVIYETGKGRRFGDTYENPLQAVCDILTERVGKDYIINPKEKEQKIQIRKRKDENLTGTMNMKEKLPLEEIVEHLED